MAKTTRPMVRIHDLESNEIIDREMNDFEFAEYEKQQEENAILKTEADAKAAQRQAIADRLGLTADELKILLG